MEMWLVFNCPSSKSDHGEGDGKKSEFHCPISFKELVVQIEGDGKSK